MFVKGWQDDGTSTPTFANCTPLTANTIMTRLTSQRSSSPQKKAPPKEPLSLSKTNVVFDGDVKKFIEELWHEKGQKCVQETLCE